MNSIRVSSVFSAWPCWPASRPRPRTRRRTPQPRRPSRSSASTRRPRRRSWPAPDSPPWHRSSPTTLAEARSYAQARRVVVREGSALWRRAVDRAQGRGPADGDLSRDDDRPLYWARSSMTREVRTWEPEFGLSDTQRAGLLDALERTSRGQTTSATRGARGSADPRDRLRPLHARPGHPYLQPVRGHRARPRRHGDPDGGGSGAGGDRRVPGALAGLRRGDGGADAAAVSHPGRSVHDGQPGAGRAGSTSSGPTGPGGAASGTTRTSPGPRRSRSPIRPHSRSGRRRPCRTRRSWPRAPAASPCTTTRG